MTIFNSIGTTCSPLGSGFATGLLNISNYNNTINPSSPLGSTVNYSTDSLPYSDLVVPGAVTGVTDAHIDAVSSTFLDFIDEEWSTFGPVVACSSNVIGTSGIIHMFVFNYNWDWVYDNEYLYTDSKIVHISDCTILDIMTFFETCVNAGENLEDMVVDSMACAKPSLMTEEQWSQVISMYYWDSEKVCFDLYLYAIYTCNTMDIVVWVSPSSMYLVPFIGDVVSRMSVVEYRMSGNAITKAVEGVISYGREDNDTLYDDIITFTNAKVNMDSEVYERSVMNNNTLGQLYDHPESEYNLDLMNIDGPVAHISNLPTDWSSYADDFDLAPRCYST